MGKSFRYCESAQTMLDQHDDRSLAAKERITREFEFQERVPPICRARSRSGGPLDIDRECLGTRIVRLGG